MLVLVLALGGAGILFIGCVLSGLVFFKRLSSRVSTIDFMSPETDGFYSKKVAPGNDAMEVAEERGPVDPSPE